MITPFELHKATQIAKLQRPEKHLSGLSPKIRQIVLSLAIYKGRGEFDGTIDSALECLREAGYEI